MQELYSNINLVRALSPAAATTNNTDMVSEEIDRAGYMDVTLAFLTGSLSDSDAVMSIKVEDSDTSGSGFAAVDSSLLQIQSTLDATPESGFQCAFDFANDNSQFKIHYRGCKRYLKVTVSPANNTGDIYCAIVAILSQPRKGAVS